MTRLGKADKPPIGAGWVLAVYLIATFVGGALLAPPTYWALQGLGMDEPFTRVTNRTLAVVALLGFFPAVRALRLLGPDQWGYAIPLQKGLRWMAVGFGLGLISMGLVVALEFAFNLRFWDSQRNFTELLNAALSGCLAGFGVALIEESCFRGGLQTAIRDSYGVRAGIWATALLYTLVHVLDNKWNGDEIGWTSGFITLARALARLAEPDIQGALLTLFFAGALLALLRQYFGHIYLSIGLHAGWIVVIQWAIKAYNSNDQHPQIWLISDDYDNIIGYLTALMLGSALAICWLWLGSKGRQS